MFTVVVLVERYYVWNRERTIDLSLERVLKLNLLHASTGVNGVIHDTHDQGV
jgi:hypothetical protein